ncbi:hypothetical protein [Chryseobacterium sp. SIMBA_029]|uniref:hypothetical protein n=1 Tax=Chryseobacterium sp. SIMBA_029 TaxID=3085772 RepID=UPI00397BBF22
MDAKDFQSHILDKNKKIYVAYINEPPFYWREKDGTVKGADIELLDTVLGKLVYHLSNIILQLLKR